MIYFCCIICRCAINHSNRITAYSPAIPKRSNAALSTISAAIAATTAATTSRAKCIEYCFYITSACQYGKAEPKCHTRSSCSSARTPRSSSTVQRIKFPLKWNVWYISRCWCARYVSAYRASSASCSGSYAIYFHSSKCKQCSGDVNVWKSDARNVSWPAAVSPGPKPVSPVFAATTSARARCPPRRSNGASSTYPSTSRITGYERSPIDCVF